VWNFFEVRAQWNSVIDIPCNLKYILMRSRVCELLACGVYREKNNNNTAQFCCRRESVSVPKCDADGEQQMAFDYNRRVYQPDTALRAFTTCTHATCRWSHPVTITHVRSLHGDNRES